MVARGRWFVGLALFVLPLFAVAREVPPKVLPPPVTAADCTHLLSQFDVAWTVHRASARADAAHRIRDLGEAACKEGRYADGVHQVRRALHDLGWKVVHPSHPASPSH